MKLIVSIPTETVVERTVDKVVGEAMNGAFCVRPRHVDFVTALVPGILSFTTAEGEEIFMAVDEAVMVKQGDQLRVSARRAIQGPSLERLEEVVEKQFKALNEREKKARQAMSKIEAGFVRRFLEIQRA